MKIVIVGTGYVGLVSGTCFSEMGVDVTCVDVDRKKIDKLQQGIIPIYEPGLEELVCKNVNAGRLHFTTDLREILDEVEVVFSAVGTPPDEDGSADLKYVLEVARSVGQNMKKYLVILICLFTICSCTEEESPYYEGGHYIYFRNSYTSDSIEMQFKRN